MTLTCTFDNRYRKRLVPCRDMDTSRVPLELEGRHRTVAEFALATGADARTHTARGTCFPMITMLTDPVRRFLSAFNHRPPESHVHPEARENRLRTCYFLACRAGSTLMKANMAGALSADEFALWPHAEDVEAGHNMATKYLGARRLYYGANGYGRMTVDGKRDLVPGADASWRPIHTVVLRNDTEGRAALTRAKRRLAAMAFVGLVERFDETLLMISDLVGLQRLLYTRHVPGTTNPRYPQPSVREVCPDLAACRDRIRQVAPFDHAVYDEFASAFNERVAALGPGFAARLRAFQKANAPDSARARVNSGHEPRIVKCAATEPAPALSP